MSGTRSAEGMLATWLGADGNAEKAKLRSQALQSYPILGPLLSTFPTIRMAVDRSDKEPLAPAIKRALGVEDSLVKFLGKMRFDVEQGKDVVTVVKLLNKLVQTNRDWLPRQQDQFDAAIDCLLVVRRLKEVTGLDDAVLIEGCKGDWTAFLLRMKKAVLFEDETVEQIDGGRLMNSAESVSDIGREFYDRVMFPVIMHFAHEITPATPKGSVRLFLAEPGIAEMNQMRKLGTVLMVGAKNAAKILEYSHKWHRYMAEMAGTEDNAADQAAATAAAVADRARNLNMWVGMTQRVQAPNGAWLVPLVAEAELRNESERLDHCVGRSNYYAQRCRTNGAQIVSVRTFEGPPDQALDAPTDDRRWRSMATAEIGNVFAMQSILLPNQLYGHRNGAPTAAVRDAYRWYSTAIEDGRIPLQIDAINNLMNSRAQVLQTDRIMNICGYDWRNPLSIYEAHQRWSRFLPPECRTMGGFVKHPDVQVFFKRVNSAALLPDFDDPASIPPELRPAHALPAPGA